jgi:8-oxo-dGTP diphosphatase
MKVRPVPGVSAAIFRGDEVLLIKRGRGHYAGLWSLPGGHIEPGEKAVDAALREVREETGVTAAILGPAGIHDVILRGCNGTLEAHYVLAVFCGAWQAGEPVAASDAAAARFVSLAEARDLPLTQGALPLIERAFALLQLGIGEGKL